MLFGTQKKQQQWEQYLVGILDAQDTEMLVIRGENDKLLFANTAARARMASSDATCRSVYENSFPGIWKHFSYMTDQLLSQPVSFHINSSSGAAFSVTASTITWLDHKSATALSLRDTSEEQAVRQRLYGLAYLDHLTGIPNRQKLREDFDRLSKEISAGKAAGALALFDLDNFKSINDTYGHNTGDLMLKRLTDHLGKDSGFAGHLYRLGGDEFVLLYSDKRDRFASDAELAQHYLQLLSGALLSYTMPNIELACTLSMGVSCFPKHGEGFSELLRKADIALYKAKTAGRNQCVLFEDQYDTAKKFKDLYINIQPILMPSGSTFGYELIDCGDNADVTEETVNLTEFNRTLDALGMEDMESNTLYFIAYSNQLLTPSVLNNLPKDSFVVQFVAHGSPTPKDLALYQKLREAGYKLALTNVRSATATSSLLALADYCKFDPNDTDVTMQSKIINANPKITFIATGMDSPSAFDSAKRTGFRLFQGFFFNQQPPVTKKTKEIDPMKVNYYRLLKLTSTDGYVDFREISQLISADMALSYKLLRLLSSAAVGVRNVSSIPMAIAYLGEDNLKKWIGLLALRGLAEDKPLELVRMSLIRARFGELLAPHFRVRKAEKYVFLLGVLSLLHIALEKTKEDLFEEIPVAKEIRSSLLTRTGPYSDLISFYESYEYANWDEIARFATENNLTCELINDCYIDAVKWYNELSKI